MIFLHAGRAPWWMLTLFSILAGLFFLLAAGRDVGLIPEALAPEGQATLLGRIWQAAIRVEQATVKAEEELLKGTGRVLKDTGQKLENQGSQGNRQPEPPPPTESPPPGSTNPPSR